MKEDQITQEKLIEQLIQLNEKLSLYETEDKDSIYNQFFNFLNLSPVGIIFVDAEGQAQIINQRAEEILGLTKEGLRFLNFNNQKKKFRSLSGREIPEDNLPFHIVKATHHPVYAKRYAYFKNNELVYLSINATPYFSSETKELLGIIATIEDITPEVLIEKEIDKEKNLAKQYLEVVGVMVVIIGIDENVKMINKRGCEILGYSEKEIVGKNWFENFLPELVKGDVRRIFYDLIKGEEEIHGVEEGFVLNKAGEERVILWHNALLRDEEGKIYATLSSGNDITERVRVQLELKESEEKYRNLFNKMLAGIAYCKMLYDENGDPYDYLFLEVNKEYEIYTGTKRKDLVGRTIREIMPAIEFVDFDWITTYGEVAKFGTQKVFEHYSKHFKKWLLINSFCPVKDHFVITVIDITERKKNEIMLNDLNEKLELHVKQRTAQLEVLNKELEAFSYSVSHDLRAPLRAIENFSKILRNKYETILDEQGLDYLNRVINSAEDMKELIDEFLKLSNVSRKKLKIERINLSKIVSKIAEGYQKNNSNIKFSIAKDVFCFGDIGLVKIVIENLISNSVKFSSNNQKPHIEFGLIREDSESVCFIRDNGIGFNMRYADKLFIPFQRLHSQDEFEGAGIGLATIQRIINKHNGKIWARGKVNEGATFYFIFASTANNNE